MEIISMKGLVEKAHGKICQDDNNSVSYRKKDGKMFSQRRCNDRDLDKKPYTDRELEIQTSFASTSQVAAAWTKANRVFKMDSNNKPTTVIDLQASTEDYRKMRAAFDAQDKIPTFQAFVWAQIVDGAVVVPDEEVSSGSGDSANQNQQNQNQQNQQQNPPQNVTQYTLSISSANEEQGTVNTSVNKAYDAGSEVEIVATAASGYAFDKWDDENTSNPRTITMNSDVTLTASFKVSSGETPGSGTGGGGMY